MQFPKRVTIHEVCPRDGFQPEKEWIPTETKIEIIDALSKTGVREIQATSFVHPRAIPQLRDAEEVIAGITKQPGVSYDALVPNVRGAERAATTEIDVWHLMISASESHNRENGNRSIAETLAGFPKVVEMAEQHGREVHAGLAVAFGCPYEGDVPLDQLAGVVGECIALGLNHVSLGDTTGMANPAQIYDTMIRLQDRFPDIDWTLHLHDTRGMALANVVAGLQAGITHYDSAAGGLGGCPFAPGATGNVATEDLVHMLDLMGIETGVDLDAVIAVARRLEEVVGHPLESRILKAGKTSDLAVQV